MSVKVLRWILVITNLLLILIPISALVLSYFLLIPKVLSDEIDRDATALAGAFAFWAVFLPLTSICFLGIVFANSCCLHLVAALLLCFPLAFGSWLITEQFLFKTQPNWTIVGISFSASAIWAVQILTELLLSCVLCCSPSSASGSSDKDDIEAAKKAEAEGDGDKNAKRRGDDGSDEEKEKLVVSFQQEQHLHQQQQKSAQGAFVPSPQAPPIEEVDEGEDDDDDDEDEPDSQARDHLNHDRNNPNHPHDLPLRSIPEEKQYLLSAGQRPASSSSGQCPLATPEDTGV